MGVLENLRDVAVLAQKIGQIELYKKILEAEDEVRDLTREKRRLEDKLEELEERLKLRATMVFRAPVYYQQGDATPFCAACYEKDGRAVHLVQNYAQRWYCNICRNIYAQNPNDDGPAFAVATLTRG